MNHHYYYGYIDAFWFTSETDKYKMTREVNDNIIPVVQYFNTFVIIICMQFDVMYYTLNILCIGLIVKYANPITWKISKKLFVNNKIIINFVVYAIVECNIVHSIGEGKARTRKFTDKRTHSSKPSDPKRDRSSPYFFTGVRNWIN